MIERTNERQPPAAALRALIAQHRGSVMVAASGLAPVLGVLDAYIVATEARLAELERSSVAVARALQEHVRGG